MAPLSAKGAEREYAWNVADGRRHQRPRAAEKCLLAGSCMDGGESRGKGARSLLGGWGPRDRCLEDEQSLLHRTREEAAARHDRTPPPNNAQPPFIFCSGSSGPRLSQGLQQLLLLMQAVGCG